LQAELKKMVSARDVLRREEQQLKQRQRLRQSASVHKGKVAGGGERAKRWDE
jgi:hypothetical protein